MFTDKPMRQLDPPPAVPPPPSKHVFVAPVPVPAAPAVPVVVPLEPSVVSEAVLEDAPEKADEKSVAVEVVEPMDETLPTPEDSKAVALDHMKTLFLRDPDKQSFEVILL